MNISALGTSIGTADSWDEMELCSIILYDFKPHDHIGLEPGDLIIDYNKGKFTLLDSETGETVKEYNILSIIGNN